MWVTRNSRLVLCVKSPNTIFFVNRIRRMVSFELGKEIKKYDFSSCHERGTKKKNSESPRESEPQTFGFRAPMLYQLSRRDSMVSKTITKFIYDSHSAYF